MVKKCCIKHISSDISRHSKIYAKSSGLIKLQRCGLILARFQTSCENGLELLVK